MKKKRVKMPSQAYAPLPETVQLLRDSAVRFLYGRFSRSIKELTRCGVADLPPDYRAEEGRDRRAETIAEWFSRSDCPTFGLKVVIEDANVKDGHRNPLPLQIFMQGTVPIRLISESEWDPKKLTDEDGCRRICSQRYGQGQVHAQWPANSATPRVAVMNLSSRTSVILFTDRGEASIDASIEEGLAIIMAKRLKGVATERRGIDANHLLAQVHIPDASLLSEVSYNTPESDRFEHADDKLRILRRDGETVSEMVAIQLKSNPDDARRFAAQHNTDAGTAKISVLVPVGHPASFPKGQIPEEILDRVFPPQYRKSWQKLADLSPTLKARIYWGSVALHAIDRVFAIKAHVAGSRFVRYEHPLMQWLEALTAEGLTDLWWFENDLYWTGCRSEQCPCRGENGKMHHGWRVKLYFYAPGSDQRRYLYVMPKEQADEFGDIRRGTPRFILSPQPTQADADTFRSLILEQLEARARFAERTPSEGPRYVSGAPPTYGRRPLTAQKRSFVREVPGADKPHPGQLDEFTREYAQMLEGAEKQGEAEA